jgi:hypothetical protein
MGSPLWLGMGVRLRRDRSIGGQRIDIIKPQRYPRWGFVGFSLNEFAESLH